MSTVNHEQLFFNYTKEHGVSARHLAARKNLVVALQRFRDSCLALDSYLEPHEDVYSRVMRLFARDIRAYMSRTLVADLNNFPVEQRMTELFAEQCVPLVDGSSACKPNFSKDTNHICVKLANQHWLFTFYHGHRSASYPVSMRSSELLILPDVLSVRQSPNFWAHLAELVRLHGHLDYDYDHAVRRHKARYPIFWGRVDDGYVVARPSVCNSSMKVLCMDIVNNLALLPISVPEPKEDAADSAKQALEKNTQGCYYVVDFHSNHDNVVSHVNIWFKGPRKLYGQGYYNTFKGAWGWYDSLTLVNCVELADFQVNSSANPTICFFTD